jgi:uncharacterized protein (TIGR02996 family)
MAKAKAKAKAAPANELGRTLLAQALETDDDATRLVYADWLEEQGDPAAQLIRLSCQLATLPEDERKPVKATLTALLTKHRAVWIDPIESWIRPIDDRPVFERGMYRNVYGTAGKYAQKATQQAMLDAATRFGVRGTMLRGKAGKVPTCATLAWTRGLWWWDCQLDDDGLAELAESPHLAGLRRLTLEKVRCTNPGIRALGRLRLKHLGLPAPVYYSKWTAAAVIDVVERSSIESLDLTGLNHIDPAELGNAPAVAKLTSLHLHVSRLADFALVRGPTNLTELRLESLRTEPADVEALLDNPTFAKLKRFSLYTYTTRLPAPLMKRISSRFETQWRRE